MTEHSTRQSRSRGSTAHRAAGSRKVVLALSTTATASLMFAMASAKPAWAPDAGIDAAPADPQIAVLSSRPSIVLPVPATAHGAPLETSVAPATPQLVQLTPVAAPTQVVTKTVVVKRTRVKSSGSR